MISESIVDHIAAKLSISSDELRAKNFYNEGQRTHFGQLIERWNVPDAWEDIHKTAEV